MPTLTIGGVAPQPVSTKRNQPEKSSVRFGYALLRLVESAYIAGAATHLVQKRAAWLDANQDHPLWPARVTEYATARRAMVRYEEDVQRWCGQLDIVSQEVTNEMIQMAIDAYGEELQGLRTILRETASRGMCWHKLEGWIRDREAADKAGQSRLPFAPGEECPF